MINFTNTCFSALMPVPDSFFLENIGPMLVPGEQIVQSFKGGRDGVVFTTKRIFAINVQGLTGTKVDYTSLPYSKIQAFSVELSVCYDLELGFSGPGTVKFVFSKMDDAINMYKLISTHVL